MLHTKLFSQELLTTLTAIAQNHQDDCDMRDESLGYDVIKSEVLSVDIVAHRFVDDVMIGYVPVNIKTEYGLFTEDAAHCDSPTCECATEREPTVEQFAVRIIYADRRKEGDKIAFAGHPSTFTTQLIRFSNVGDVMDRTLVDNRIKRLERLKELNAPEIIIMSEEMMLNMLTTMHDHLLQNGSLAAELNQLRIETPNKGRFAHSPM